MWSRRSVNHQSCEPPGSVDGDAEVVARLEVELLQALGVVLPKPAGVHLPHLPHHILAAPVGVDKGVGEAGLGAPRRGLHLLHKVTQLAAGAGK